jgi:hypothetical protein
VVDGAALHARLLADGHTVAGLAERTGIDPWFLERVREIVAAEAGLAGRTLYARLDTPLHSVLHEFSHYVCMTPERRTGLDRDAGGDDAEERRLACGFLWDG